MQDWRRMIGKRVTHDEGLAPIQCDTFRRICGRQERRDIVYGTNSGRVLLETRNRLFWIVVS